MLCYIGLIILLMDSLFMILPPKKPNKIYGYVSQLSRRNKDTWKEAQIYSGVSLVALGYIYIILGLIINIVLPTNNTIYEIPIAIIGFVLTIIIDEEHLKHVFDINGKRRASK